MPSLEEFMSDPPLYSVGVDSVDPDALTPGCPDWESYALRENEEEWIRLLHLELGAREIPIEEDR
jgi:hypothetical protein